MLTRQRWEEAYQQVEWVNKHGGCPLCNGDIEVQKEENFYILVCNECQTVIGEII